MARQKAEEQRPKIRSLYDILEGWEEAPLAWKPVPGEVLVGTVAAYDTYVGKYGESKVCILRDQAEDTLISVYLSPTVLFNEFKKIRPKIGEKVGIRYLGKAEGDDGYHRYKVVVDRELDVDAFFGVVPSPLQAPLPLDIAGVDDVPL
jgi:hypothetical protein